MKNNIDKHLGIYVHIPFCRKKCDYCDFYSVCAYDDNLLDRYLKALVKQLDDYTLGGSRYTVDTLYIGGGTPSVFGGKRLAALVKEVGKRFDFTRDVEITVEVNPESADKALFKQLKKAGVNRISMGVQSSCDSQLAALGRLHDFKTAENAVLLCRKYCINNISLDLMYGLEGQSMDSWLESVEAIAALDPMHISCYALTLEEHTPMYRRDPVLPDDDTVADMYLAAVDKLGALGYEQYEISNFSRRGYRSAHNSRYWDLRPYIGIGAAAHSFFGDKRYSTVRDIDRYINGILSGDSVVDEADDVAVKNRSGEYIMLRLRTSDGIDEAEFSRRFGSEFDNYAEKLKKYIPTGHAECGGGVYRLTPKGFFISNTIICDVLDI
ncbi:MAG: radical SAM family heme chaperone HemW [Clostridia bacterium]|nr:radical SAM family heme chaperone HemW [Clostridia bacterium]MBR5902687.1 radical SAM family heme chaperone HemW [Clostridia bacterium]